MGFNTCSSLAVLNQTAELSGSGPKVCQPGHLGARCGRCSCYTGRDRPFHRTSSNHRVVFSVLPHPNHPRHPCCRHSRSVQAQPTAATSHGRQPRHRVRQLPGAGHGMWCGSPAMRVSGSLRRPLCQLAISCGGLSAVACGRKRVPRGHNEPLQFYTAATAACAGPGAACAARCCI
jgi:hypothetical protein